MKKLGKLKLNQLDKKELVKKEQLEIRGGCYCILYCPELEIESEDGPQVSAEYYEY